MTFKKLKIFVAVSLILFIFIVGNIFAFGYLQKVYVNYESKDKPKDTQTGINTVITKNESENKGTTSGTMTRTKIGNTGGTVSHRRRTRAS